MIILLVVIFVIVASCLPSRDKADTAASSPARASEPITREAPEVQRARLLAEAKSVTGTHQSRLAAAEKLLSSFAGSDEAKQAEPIAKEMREAIRKASLGKQWQYWDQDDGMTSRTSRGATVTSSNTHEFDFPYAGAQRAKLVLRRHPRHGNDVMLEIERGQLQCTSYSGCDVLVRFGEGQPRRYKAMGPADNSSETLFIEGYADFVRRMQAVETVRIQANVYQQGAPLWEFDVSGFSPQRLIK
ncbi:hypothetical protein [Stenotrophomonas lacuserhaii]|uniref:hypothetical protein n=1 Tax=Stenotrophomonas lacuserhaii TaxID=2760084 RepID=UPI001C722C42|nr:hypothetical protein [Stenotrophomonas lacuserhaii]